jgi:anaerobic magnesium-protoporphyrin IX monomethyl ester cyclase
LRVLLISTPHPLEEAPLPPLSLAYLAASLEQHGIDVEILDFLVTRYTPEKLRRKLADYRPQLVGVTCVTLNYPRASRILKTCKAYDPSITTLIGGPHVTFALRETLLRSPWIDAIVIGEGERTLVQIATALERGKDFRQLPGIAFADEDMVVKTEPRPLIQDLDELPMPARQLLPLARYRALGMPSTVITSRGCPYRCIFCSGRRMFGPKVRFRDPGLVVDEIEQIHRDFGFPRINIVDDTFTLNHRHAGQVCEELLRRKLKVKWAAFARADTVTAELAELMKRAGCDFVLFGVESADEGILKTIRKGITTDLVERGVKTATAAGIRVFNSFILGLPGESPETARRSMAFAQRLDHTYGAKYGFHVLSPIPGTELYERAEDYGLRILSRNWARYDANQPVTVTATMTVDMVKEIVDEYDGLMRHLLEDTKRRAEAGDAQCAESVAEKERTEFVWRLLNGDVIERLSREAAATAADSHAAEAKLVQRVSHRLGIPLEVVQQQMGRLVADGSLQLEQSSDGVRWRWSDGPTLVAGRGSALAPSKP